MTTGPGTAVAIPSMQRIGGPTLFVLLWSTGFVGAKYGLPYAEPFTFLSVRLLLCSSARCSVNRKDVYCDPSSWWCVS